MRVALARVVLSLLACFVLASCADDVASRYLDDPAFRRAEMVASLTTESNDYAAARIESYESGRSGDWSGLAIWNPPAVPIAATELDAPGGTRVDAPLDEGAHSLAIDARASAGDHDALVALGRAAFFGYPTQLLASAGPALRSRTDAARYGFWSGARGDVGSLVRVALPDGTTTVALSCASCHSRVDAHGTVLAGVPNRALDLGALAIDADPYSANDPVHTAQLRAWGAGRLDVSTREGTEPVAIPDLRPVRWLTHLHRDATVVQRDVISLALRIETLIVTAHHRVVRPPREVALGLALYLHSLADTLPARDALNERQQRGRTLFVARCASCHAGDGFTSSPVSLATVGTDPTLGRSLERGTGMYRVPSLRGVSTRGPLLHDGTIAGLDAFFDPSRLDDGFTGRLHGGVGAVRGHEFGLDLVADDRAALVAYVESL